MDPDDISTADLLAGLDTSCADPSSAVEMWLAAAGYVPGCHRVLIADMYREYCVWCAGASDITIDITHPHDLALELRQYLRIGRGKKGRFAYVSRQLRER